MKTTTDKDQRYVIMQSSDLFGHNLSYLVIDEAQYAAVEERVKPAITFSQEEILSWITGNCDKQKVEYNLLLDQNLIDNKAESLADYPASFIDSNRDALLSFNIASANGVKISFVGIKSCSAASISNLLGDQPVINKILVNPENSLKPIFTRSMVHAPKTPSPTTEYSQLSSADIISNYKLLQPFEIIEPNPPKDKTAATVNVQPAGTSIAKADNALVSSVTPPAMPYNALRPLDIIEPNVPKDKTAATVKVQSAGTSITKADDSLVITITPAVTPYSNLIPLDIIDYKPACPKEHFQQIIKEEIPTNLGTSHHHVADDGGNKVTPPIPSNNTDKPKTTQL